MSGLGSVGKSTTASVLEVTGLSVVLDGAGVVLVSSTCAATSVEVVSAAVAAVVLLVTVEDALDDDVVPAETSLVLVDARPSEVVLDVPTSGADAAVLDVPSWELAVVEEPGAAVVTSADVPLAVTS